MHCFARGRAVSTVDHLMKRYRFCAQRLKEMKSWEDKAKDVLIGSCTDDTVWDWVRDKAWTCKLTEGPLLPPSLPLANLLSPSVVSSVSRSGLDSPGRLYESSDYPSFLILIPSRVHSKVIQYASRETPDFLCLCSLTSPALQILYPFDAIGIHVI